MMKIENDCVGPCPQGCLGSGCPNRHAQHFYCDRCGDEERPDRLYDFNGEMLCKECLLGNFATVECRM